MLIKMSKKIRFFIKISQRIAKTALVRIVISIVYCVKVCDMYCIMKSWVYTSSTSHMKEPRLRTYEYSELTLGMISIGQQWHRWCMDHALATVESPLYPS